MTPIKMVQALLLPRVFIPLALGILLVLADTGFQLTFCNCVRV